MIDTEKILQDRPQLKALTSLLPEEFSALLRPFGHRWHQYHKHYSLLGKRRRPRFNYKKATKTLPSVSDKLLFILIWFKTGSIQQQLAAEFDLKQSHVSHWLKALRPLLHLAIEDLHCQPAQGLDQLLRLFRQRKAKQNKPLTDFEKSFNSWVSSVRSVVEHSISGIKRLFLLNQMLRYHKQSVRHQIFIIGCGLHNLRVRFRARAYARGAQRLRARLSF